MEEAINKLREYNQEQIIDIINKLSNEEQIQIFNQINNISFDEIDTLYNELTQKEKVNISQVEELQAINLDRLSKIERENIIECGKDIIKNGKYALVTMSGGQGTRLGYNKPKGMFKVDIAPKPKYLFEILADKLKEINKIYNVTIPWYIMTSDENNDNIEDFFTDNNYFEYNKEYIKFFKQGNLPLITENKKVIIGSDKKIKEAADGNGGIFNSMYKNGILDDMKKRNIKWIFISSIDNILLKIADPALIGLAESKNVEIATKSILKNSPDEKVGAICKIDNKIKVIEYSEMSEEMKNAYNTENELKFGESHVMCNLFKISALEKLAEKKLPYHIAHKKSDYLDKNLALVKPTEPNVYKFETFIFDGWEYFDNIAILRGKREDDFAPIKNKDGIDSPKTAIELYNNYINLNN